MAKEGKGMRRTGARVAKLCICGGMPCLRRTGPIVLNKCIFLSKRELSGGGVIRLVPTQKAQSRIVECK